MLPYPDIDPVAISVGSFKVHWYGLMYVAAFAAFILLGAASTRAWASGGPKRR